MPKKTLCFLICLSGLLYCSVSYAQFFIISSVHRPEEDSMAVFALTIRNTSGDSMMVLHSQETESPPFINNYRYFLKQDSLTIFVGKSNNPLIPETYRATKTMGPRSKTEIYFSIPKKLVKNRKAIDIWYSLIDDKFMEDFRRLERIETNETVERCRRIKDRYGVVHHKVVYF